MSTSKTRTETHRDESLSGLVPGTDKLTQVGVFLDSKLQGTHGTLSACPRHL